MISTTQLALPKKWQAEEWNKWRDKSDSNCKWNHHHYRLKLQSSMWNSENKWEANVKEVCRAHHNKFEFFHLSIVVNWDSNITIVISLHFYTILLAVFTYKLKIVTIVKMKIVIGLGFLVVIIFFCFYCFRQPATSSFLFIYIAITVEKVSFHRVFR